MYTLNTEHTRAESQCGTVSNAQRLPEQQVSSFVEAT